MAGYRTKSVIEPIKSPASFKISENGDSYILSFLGNEKTIPRRYVKSLESFFAKHPSFVPTPLIIADYIMDKFK